MRLHHPVLLISDLEEYLIVNGHRFIGGYCTYHVGEVNEEIVIHKSCINPDGPTYFGSAVLLRKTYKHEMVAQALIDVLIEGMGSKIDDTLVHYSLEGNKVYMAGSKEGAAVIASSEYLIRGIASNVKLPFNKIGLEVATQLLKSLRRI